MSSRLRDDGNSGFLSCSHAEHGKEVLAVLSWSNSGYKLTLGVGSLAIAGMLSELWRDVLPAWAALAIALVPLVMFVFTHPGELPVGIVLVAHVVGSVWYVVVAAGLLIVLLSRAGPLPRGWPVYPLCVVAGAIPCGTVLYRAARGKYQSPADSESGRAEQSEATDQPHK
jgi:hypothetical protein